MSRSPVVLDFDASTLPVAVDEHRIPLHEWQESIRFGCRMQSFAKLSAELQNALPEQPGVVFLGSGDYHHVTALLLSRLDAQAPIDLVVCDNHPDNMRYPFGIHCGSWVSHAAAMAHIRHIYVIGITSGDMAWGHAWEHRLTPLFRKKLTYWTIGQPATWLAAFAGRHHDCASPDALLQAFLPVLANSDRVYLSVDKDVCDPATAPTTWDQGVFTEDHLMQVIEACSGKLIGADICGDASVYAYKSRFKRLLAGLDGLTDVPQAELAEWEFIQQALNKRLLERLVFM